MMLHNLLAKTGSIALLLVLVTCLVYANSLTNGYVWDDNTIVLNNPDNLLSSRIPSFFTSADAAFSEDATPYYRPLNRLSYMVDARFFGLNPALSHGFNILLHILNSILLFLAARKLSGDLLLAGMAAILFALHPVNAEAVNFISGRNNLLALFFSLAALLLFLRGEERRSNFAIGSAAAVYFCGLLCKETALMLLPFILVWRMPSLRDLEGWKRMAAATFPFAVAAALYLALRSHALSGIIGGGLLPLGFAERMGNNLYIIPKYLVQLIVPVRLNAHYAVPSGFLSGSPWIYAVWAGLVGAVVYLVRQGSAVTRFGLLWIGVNFIPISNIIPIPSAPMADRYLYLPAMGFWLILADLGTGAWRKGQHRRLLVGGFVLAAAVLGGLTVKRNTVWRDEVSLFSGVVAVDPANTTARYNLGLAYKRAGNPTAAAREWEQVVSIDPRHSLALNQLGNFCYVQGLLGEAFEFYSRALAANANNSEAHYNLGLVLEKTGRPAEAIPHYEAYLEQRAATSDPNIPRVRQKVMMLREAIRQ